MHSNTSITAGITDPTDKHVPVEESTSDLINESLLGTSLQSSQDVTKTSINPDSMDIINRTGSLDVTSSQRDPVDTTNNEQPTQATETSTASVVNAENLISIPSDNQNLDNLTIPSNEETGHNIPSLGLVGHQLQHLLTKFVRRM